MNYMRLLRSIPRQTFTKVSSVNYAAQHPSKFLEIQDRWREKDGISGRWQLIYKAPMDNALNYASTYLTFTSAFASGCGIYYANFIYDNTLAEQPVLLGDDVIIANSPTELLVYMGAFVMFHVAVKVLLSKYVIRMYKNGDNYIAIFRGHYLNSIKKHKFHLKDFKKLKPVIVIGWGDARFDIGNKHVIIMDNYFKTPEYFNYLLYKNKEEVDDE